MSLGDHSSSEATINVEVVRKLIAAQFPQWADLPVTKSREQEQGVDNATYRLGADMSVRLPRYQRWVGQVHREQEWLPKLAPHLPLPVSMPIERGEPGAGYPFPWSVYRWLDGERAEPGHVKHAAEDLTEFFQALQGIDADGGPPPEWSNGFRGVHITDECDSPVIKERILPKIKALHGVYDADAVMAVWDAAITAPAWHKDPVWVHGDPAVGNLLAVNGRFSAVIDFGTMAVGDPAVDLIAAWQWLTPEARQTFRENTDDATWARGRGWGLSSWLPAPGELTDHHRKGLDQLVADLTE